MGARYDHPVKFHEIEQRYRAGFARYAGVDAAVFEHPGTTVAPVDDRRGTGGASAYAIGAHTIVYCDPVVVDRVGELRDPDRSLPVDAVADWAATHGAELIGGGWNHLSDETMLTPVDPPRGATIAMLEREQPADRELIRALVEVTDPDEADEADLALDNLDPFIVALLDGDVGIGAYASERPSDHDEAFADIAILTRHDKRHQGWGSAAVSTLCRHVFDRGRFPLYRCNWDNTESRLLALSLGFVEVASLAAIRFTLDSQPN
jgi:hypothetical protein